MRTFVDNRSGANETERASLVLSTASSLSLSCFALVFLADVFFVNFLATPIFPEGRD